MSDRFIIQLTVVITSVILGMVIYPWLRRKFVGLIEKIYLQTRDNKSAEENQRSAIARKTLAIEDEIPSIIGKSKWNPGQGRTKAATDFESEKEKENASIFASESKEDDSKMDDINISLEKVENLSEDEFDEEFEQEKLDEVRGALQASGVSFDELIKTGRVIQKEKPSEEEKDTTGQVLYQHQSTEMLDQIISKDEATLIKVNDLIHFHMKRHNLNTEDPNEGLSDSDNFKDFDISSIF